MKTKEVLDGLERECGQRGVKLIYDELQSEGGLCWLRGSYYIIINRRSSAETRIRLIRDGLAEVRRRDNAPVGGEAAGAEPDSESRGLEAEAWGRPPDAIPPQSA